MAPDAWTCPECGRGFGRPRPSRRCEPVLDVIADLDVARDRLAADCTASEA